MRTRNARYGSPINRSRSCPSAPVLLHCFAAAEIQFSSLAPQLVNTARHGAGCVANASPRATRKKRAKCVHPPSSLDRRLMSLMVSPSFALRSQPCCVGPWGAAVDRRFEGFFFVATAGTFATQLCAHPSSPTAQMCRGRPYARRCAKAKQNRAEVSLRHVTFPFRPKDPPFPHIGRD